MYIQQINNISKFDFKQKNINNKTTTNYDKNHNTNKIISYIALGTAIGTGLLMLYRTNKTRILDIIAKDKKNDINKFNLGRFEIEIKNFKDNNKIKSIDELSGVDKAKKFVEQYQLLKQNPEIMKEHNIEEFSSLLFWGVPGTGKTVSAMGIAKKLDADYIQLDKEFFDSMFVSEGSKTLAELINQIEQHANQNPKKQVVVFMDEIDGTIAVDKSLNSKHSEDLLNTLKRGITYLQEKCDNILFIGATNKDPNGLKSDNTTVRLNSALLDRFKYLIEFDLPKSDAINESWTKLINTKSGKEKFTKEQNNFISDKFYELKISFRDLNNIADKLNRADAVEYCKTGSYNSKKNLIKILRSDEKVGYDSVKQEHLPKDKIEKTINDIENFLNK